MYLFWSHDYLVHTLIPYAAYSLFFSGGPSGGPSSPKRQRPRYRNLVLDEETGVYMDKTAIRERELQAQRKAERQRAERRSKRK